MLQSILVISWLCASSCALYAAATPHCDTQNENSCIAENHLDASQAFVQVLRQKIVSSTMIDDVLSEAQSPIETQSVSGFPLPSYLEAVEPSDPNYESLKASAIQWALGEPEQGGLVDFMIVRFKEDTPIRRIYGSTNSECGWWWGMDYEGTYSETMHLSTMQEWMDTNGICPEWNLGERMVRCTARAGWEVVVGQGQSAKCQDGTILYPPATLLQLNGNGCGNSVSCESCALQRNDTVGTECYSGD